MSHCEHTQAVEPVACEWALGLPCPLREPLPRQEGGLGRPVPAADEEAQTAAGLQNTLRNWSKLKMLSSISSLNVFSIKRGVSVVSLRTV